MDLTPILSFTFFFAFAFFAILFYAIGFKALFLDRRSKRIFRNR